MPWQSALSPSSVRQSLLVLLYNMVTLITPELTIEPSRIDSYRSNEAFVNSPSPFAFSLSGPAFAPVGIRESFPGGAVQNQFEGMDETEITELRLRRLDTELDAHSSRAKLSIIRQIIIILISALLFFVHWQLAHRIGNTKNTVETQSQ